MKINLSPSELEFIRNKIESQLGAYECVCNKCLTSLKNQYHINEKD